ncbi:Csu type fimbrial protein [Zhongshania aquimaris]|uniref:Spore coat U domain-containing protein n=1 Tax=Zhongshania aquimaris TaxID=2857107 RepID=A0ABS6VR70_9GAMM|nr:spore coat protein U domain-containing protein [Zhongshania aquimaris]MBW2940813.1 spore coat U domain-containing protein [Zhongshania aquimaris]
MTARYLRKVVLTTLLAIPAAAHASTSCTASMTNVSFGASDPFTGWGGVAATLNYQCNTGGLALLATARVRLCFSIGVGAQGSGVTIVPRRMTSGGNELQFNLYRDSARSVVWPIAISGVNRYEVDLQYSVPVLGGSGSGSVTVYGDIISPQNTAVPGSYSNNFSNFIDALMSFRANEALLGTPSWPTSCTSGGTFSGTGSFPFVASATVEASCNPVFSVQNISFGTQGVLSANIDTTAIVAPQCTNTTPYQIGLDNGQNASGSTRRMHNGAGKYVSYELYRDVARSQRWGDTLNSDTLADTGTGSAQAQSIYARTAPQITPSQGSYSDTVTVTIYY